MSESKKSKAEGRSCRELHREIEEGMRELHIAVREGEISEQDARRKGMRCVVTWSVKFMPLIVGLILSPRSAVFTSRSREGRRARRMERRLSRDAQKNGIGREKDARPRIEKCVAITNREHREERRYWEDEEELWEQVAQGSWRRFASEECQEGEAREIWEDGGTMDEDEDHDDHEEE